MAQYTQIKRDILYDELMIELTAEEKAFWFCLILNPEMDMTGVTSMPLKVLSVLCGLSMEALKTMINRFKTEYKRIDYDETTGEIFVINYPKYNWNKSPKMIQSLKKNIGNIKSARISAFLTDLLEKFEADADRVWIGYRYPMDTLIDVVIDVVTVTDTVVDTVTDVVVDTDVDVVNCQQETKNQNQTSNETQSAKTCESVETMASHTPTALRGQNVSENVETVETNHTPTLKQAPQQAPTSLQGTSKTKPGKYTGHSEKDAQTANVQVWFDSFWSMYPNKANKKQAFKTFQQVVRDEATYSAIMVDLTKRQRCANWLDAIKRGQKQYIPHPSTYLNGERWQDEYELVAPSFVDIARGYDDAFISPIGDVIDAEVVDISEILR